VSERYTTRYADQEDKAARAGREKQKQKQAKKENDRKESWLIG